MAVLTAPAAPLSPSLPQAAGPSCTLQRSGSLWQLGIEAQELTTAIGQLAQQLEADDDDSRAKALPNWKPPCWLMKATRPPSLPRPMPPAG